MDLRTIAGVDFSGGGGDTTGGNTWVTKGCLNGMALTIDEPRWISRKELRGLLVTLPDGSVASLDFPFGVAHELFSEFKPGQHTMKDVWDHVAEMKFSDFDTLRAKHPKIKRNFDKKHYSEVAQSPQDERMRYMTYHGIKMLKELHKKTPDRWHIPPLNDGRTHKNRVTLLEVMPGAALRSRCLPFREYKSNDKNKGPKSSVIVENRRRILNKSRLTDKFGINVPNFEKHRDFFIYNDDALDSFIAAIVAALWTNQIAFHLPQQHDLHVRSIARLEGCFYVPEQVRKPSA